LPYFGDSSVVNCVGVGTLYWQVASANAYRLLVRKSVRQQSAAVASRLLSVRHRTVNILCTSCNRINQSINRESL